MMKTIFEKDENIVSMVEHKDEIFVATSKRVFHKKREEKVFKELAFAATTAGAWYK